MAGVSRPAAIARMREHAQDQARSPRRGCRGRQREYALRLGDLLKNGESRANVMLAPGDVIIIPESMF